MSELTIATIFRDKPKYSVRSLSGKNRALPRVSQALPDIRRGKNTQHDLTAPLRQSIYGIPMAYDDTNDAERPALDSATRQVAGGRTLAYGVKIRIAEEELSAEARRRSAQMPDFQRTCLSCALSGSGPVRLIAGSVEI